MVLTDCEFNKWYEVIDGCSALENGSTILYEGLAESGNHFVIAEGLVDEIGRIITPKMAGKIIVEELVF